MSTYIPLSSSQHSGMYWSRPDNLAYTRSWNMVPLVIQEMQHIMPVVPLAFRPVRRNNENHFELVALLSPVPGRNLYLRPDDKWVAGYIPAWIRLFPFRSMSTPDGKKEVLCIAEDALKDEAGTGTHQLFLSTGEAAPALKKIMSVAEEYARGRAITQRAVQSLQAMGLIKPWPIRVGTEKGKSAKVSGIHHIDSKALGELSPEALAELNRNGGLQIAYAQLLSEQRSAHFGRLLRVQEETQPEPVQLNDIDRLFGTQDDTLKFNF